MDNHLKSLLRIARIAGLEITRKLATVSTDEDARHAERVALQAGAPPQEVLAVTRKALFQGDPVAWTTYGPLRGRGPIRKSRKEALLDLQRHSEECRRAGRYSDRTVVWLDKNGYIYDNDTWEWCPHI